MNLTKKVPEFKVVFVGDTAVGKTSIIMRYQHDVFMTDFQSTVGAAFVSKQVKTKYGEATLHVWDTAGQERYRSLVPMYARSATAALIVYDVSDEESFSSVEQWLIQLKKDMPSDCMLYLVGNKTDLNPNFNKYEPETFAEANRMKLFFVSAKSGEGIQELFKDVALSIPISKFKGVAEDTVLLPKKGDNNSSCC